MVPRRVTSPQHPLVKRSRKLRESAQFRREEQAVVITSRQLVMEQASVLNIHYVLATTPLPLKDVPICIVPQALIDTIVGFSSEDSVVAEISYPPPQNVETLPNLLVLDQVGDPGNVGTLFRSALGLGWDGVILIEGSADPYNDKALRASRGAPLLMPWQSMTWPELSSSLEELPRQIIVADTRGTPLSQMHFRSPILLVLGHETRGPSPTALSLGTPITIPLDSRMESLNVSAAAAILLYEVMTCLN